MTHRFGRGTVNAALSVGIMLLCWVIRAMTSFWLILVIVTLPLAISLTRRAVENVLRPPNSTQAEGGAPSVVGTYVDRGIRGLLIIGAVTILAWGWGIDLEHLRDQETWFGRLADGVLTAIVILLVADVLWHAIKAAIDRKLAEAGDPGLPNTEEARKRARMRTLLPIFRNILFVVVIAVAVLMALSAMGVQIARWSPARGSSALRSVWRANLRPRRHRRHVLLNRRCVPSPRIHPGRPLQGHVEGSSIRSVRLRHHRGPVFTVPFNLSTRSRSASPMTVTSKRREG